MSVPASSLSPEVFAAAVERVVGYRWHRVVVKLGGSAMEDPLATDTVLRSVAVLNRLGLPLVLVHGGGKRIDRAMAEAGLIPKKIAGRRYTDEPTLAVVVRVLGQINQELVNRLRERGVPARGFTDPDSFPLIGRRLVLPGLDLQPVDLGRVGTVTTLRPLPFDPTPDGPTLPVIPSLAWGEDGDWLNVNADTAAAAVAGAWAADQVIFLTDTPGVLRDRTDPATLIPRLSERESRDLIASGVIDGGMVPKVEACLDALAAGARSARILDGGVPFSLLQVFLNDAPAGTEIYR